MDGNRAYFDRDEAARPLTAERLQPAEAAILATYEEAFAGKRVLDLGCGDGRTTRFLAALAGTYTGVDYAPRRIACCRRRFPDLGFHVADARDLSAWERGSFDAVLFSYNGLDCVDHAGRLGALAEIRRVLVDGGLFVFSSHNRARLVEPTEPRLEIASNPYRQLKNVARYLRQRRNRRRNRPRERREGSYALVNEASYDYGLVVYFIDRVAQVAQLVDAGFECLAVYGAGADPLGASDPGNAPWLSYVARAVEPPGREARA